MFLIKLRTLLCVLEQLFFFVQLLYGFYYLVRLEGFEPPVFRFVAERFIQLSYKRIIILYIDFLIKSRFPLEADIAHTSIPKLFSNSPKDIELPAFITSSIIFNAITIGTLSSAS